VRPFPLASTDAVEYTGTSTKPSSNLTAGRLILHASLLVLTLATSFYGGVIMSPHPPSDFLHPLQDPHILSSGLAYALTLIAILLAHEMGHYLACRYYGIRASLPYFIPAPTFIGTFGAFIRIKEPITSRRALFDIGIAGPLAGFAVAIPAAFVGLLFAEPAPPPSPSGEYFVFQDPLMFIAIQRWFDLPTMMEWNPVYFAAWVGMLATSLNLLPVGQLDGGHVAYALVGRRGHRAVAISVFALV